MIIFRAMINAKDKREAREKFISLLRNYSFYTANLRINKVEQGWECEAKA